MAAFLLWNVQNRNRDLLVQSIVREHNVDVVLLVEVVVGYDRNPPGVVGLDTGFRC